MTRRRYLGSAAAAAAAAGAAGAAALILLARGWGPGSGPAGPAAGSSGSELYATSAGVVWSVTPSSHLGQVARSTDGGRTWRVVLPGPGPHTGLAVSGSYFLGADDGWVVHSFERGGGIRGPREVTTVIGTSDGGRHWWRSATLPRARSGCCNVAGDELGFTDPQHGWLYGMQWTVQGDLVWGAEEQLWQTSDGGHTWTAVPGSLPLQGTMDNGDELCPDEGPFQIAFANQQDGWLTAGSCSAIGSAPRVWRTADGGRTWTASALPAPPGGWPTANDTYSGVSAGRPWIVGSQVLVAVAGQAGLDIEATSDGGRRWHLASHLASGRLGYARAGWFQPVDARHWVISAPGAVTRTSNAGRTWRVLHPEPASTGGAFWFTSPARGYARGSAGRTLATSDGGLTWTAGAAPPPPRPAPGPAVTQVQEISPGLAFASGPDGLRVSRDGGRTWQALPAVPARRPLGLVQFPGASTGFVTGHASKQFWRTTNGGRSWTPLPEPGQGPPGQVQFWTPSLGAARTVASGDFVTADGGSTWRPLTLPRGYSLSEFIKFSQPKYPGHAGSTRYGFACFAGQRTGWAVAYPRHPVTGQAVLVSTDAGAHWHLALPATTLHAGKENITITVWLAGCRGSQAWVAVERESYGPGGGTSYDLLHTSDDGKTWQDALHLPNGSSLAAPAVPLSPGARQASALPARLVISPEPMALPSASAAWLTLVTGDGGLALAVTSDAGQHWQVRWYPAPRHAPRTAPAAPSGLPAGLPWLATTATGSRRAWVLLASTDGSGQSYLYATSDAGATWRRIMTFGPAR